MSPFAEYVTTEIKVWMARRKMNQGDLAARLGHDQTWVSKRLGGRTAVSLDDLHDIADALDIDPMVLLPGNGGPVAATGTADANGGYRPTGTIAPVISIDLARFRRAG